MPQASQGSHISTSAQVEPNSIETTDIKDGEIVNADIAAAAAIAQSKLALAITNAEVDAAAAIVDTKLAQITTASKVSGAALTSLGSIPAGAGIIPSANLPTPAASRLISKSQTAVNDADNSNEQTAYSFTLNGGELSTGNILRVRVFINAATYHASSAPGKIYLKYGATELDNISIPSGVTAAQGFVDLFIIGNAATNAQVSRSCGIISTIYSHADSGSAAIDSTANQTVSICTKWTGSGWGQNITLGGYIAEILKA